MDDDKTTSLPADGSPELDSAPKVPAPSQFASSLWGTKDWEESEWAPAASGLSATVKDPPAAAPVEKGQPPRLTGEQPASTQVIGGYAVIKPLGDEAEGLFLARHAKLTRVVSLKAITLPDVEDAALLRDFVARARGAARLQDPHLVEVHDFVEQADKWFAVTEPLFGESLRSRVRRAPLKISVAVGVIEQAAQALAVLRRARRAHGAVTSRALFLVQREQLVDHLELLDFGAGSKQDALVAFSELAPERKDGTEADARADVWGLGSVLFELLEGRPPSEAGGLSPVSRSGEPIPPLLAELITRCLQPDPRARFSGVESMASALPHALGLAPRPMPSRTSYPALQKVVSAAPQPPPARPRRWGWAAALAGALGLLVVSAGGWWLVQDPPAEVVAPPQEASVEPPPAPAPPAVAAAPAVHPVLLLTAGGKLIDGALQGGLSQLKLKPGGKKKPPGRRR